MYSRDVYGQLSSLITITQTQRTSVYIFLSCVKTQSGKYKNSIENQETDMYFGHGPQHWILFNFQLLFIHD